MSDPGDGISPMGVAADLPDALAHEAHHAERQLLVARSLEAQGMGAADIRRRADAHEVGAGASLAFEAQP